MVEQHYCRNRAIYKGLLNNVVSSKFTRMLCVYALNTYGDSFCVCVHAYDEKMLRDVVYHFFVKLKYSAWNVRVTFLPWTTKLSYNFLVAGKIPTMCRMCDFTNLWNAARNLFHRLRICATREDYIEQLTFVVAGSIFEQIVHAIFCMLKKIKKSINKCANDEQPCKTTIRLNHAIGNHNDNTSCQRQTHLRMKTFVLQVAYIIDSSFRT